MRRIHETPHSAASRLGLIGLTVLWGCGSGLATDVGELNQTPPGQNTTIPFPIDRGDDGSATPGTYKGLPLRLADNGAPVITPVDGVIGLVCVGMSNGSLECSDFRNRVGTELAGQINPAVRVVNCAVGGHAIEKWIDPAFDADLWDLCITRRLPEAGVRLDQVRVLWHKAANQFTTGPGNTPLPTYPSAGSDYQAFSANLSGFAARVRGKFPAAQAIPLRLPHPPAQRLGRTAHLCRDRANRGPLRPMLGGLFLHQPHRALPHLRGIPCPLVHGSNLSTIGASGNPGAIQ
jgi:hypothetical protein